MSSSDAAASSSGSFPVTEKPKAEKIKVKLVAVGNAPLLKRSKFLVSRDDQVFKLAKQVRKWLGMSDQDGSSLFLYVNSSFAPSVDQPLGNLFDNFKTGNELIINYSLTHAYG